MKSKFLMFFVLIVVTAALAVSLIDQTRSDKKDGSLLGRHPEKAALKTPAVVRPKKLRARPSGLEELESRIKSYIRERPGKIGVFVVLEDGSIVGVDATAQLPTASLIKLPIAAAVYHEVGLGRLALNEKLIVPAVNPAYGGQVFRAGSAVEVDQLLKYMLSQSDNAAANAIISRLGMERINSDTVLFGARNTKLKRIMLDQKAISLGIENLSTPADMALLLKKIVGHQVLRPDDCEALLGKLKLNQDKKLIASLGSAEVIHKSGNVQSANGFTVGDVAVVKSGGRQLILAIMTGAQPSESAGAESIEDLAKIVMDKLSKR